MDETSVTRAYLESLTTDELIIMADKWGIDIPYGLDRIFIIEELFEIASEEDEENGNPSEMDLVDSGPYESVPLPKQYNITFIEVMVRDPLWAFVFWEIKAQDKEQFEKAQDFDGYYLKVSPLETPRDGTDGVFRVPVKPDDTAWYLGFNSVMAEGISPDSQRHYKVELCVVLKGNETVLAISAPFGLPGLYELPSSSGKQESGIYSSPLGWLSGYRDFHIIRSSERLFRSKRGVQSGSNE